MVEPVRLFNLVKHVLSRTVEVEMVENVRGYAVHAQYAQILSGLAGMATLWVKVFFLCVRVCVITSPDQRVRT